MPNPTTKVSQSIHAYAAKSAGGKLEPFECKTGELQSREVEIKVHACGVCRTDLHIRDGELKKPNLPLILGHEIVGTVESLGPNTHKFQKGDRIGIPWLGKTCGTCPFCKESQENLCDNPSFTGYQRQGGFAEYTTCLEDYAIALFGIERYSATGIAIAVWGGGDPRYKPSSSEKSRIYKVLSRRGISLRDGRNGQTPESQQTIRDLQAIANAVGASKKAPKLKISLSHSKTMTTKTKKKVKKVRLKVA